MISNPRRRELYSLANGMATFSVCRNNDIDGYWGLGILASYAERVSAKEIEVLVFPIIDLPEPLSTYQRNLKMRFKRTFSDCLIG
ncbi:MAG: hypothetical protein JKX81_13015 [Arenicella sp.]|nr:hypothetical protein [Arenicella sp.]